MVAAIYIAEEILLDQFYVHKTTLRGIQAPVEDHIWFWYIHVNIFRGVGVTKAL